jgi:hypothetical protein
MIQGQNNPRQPFVPTRPALRPPTIPSEKVYPGLSRRDVARLVADMIG